MIGNKNVEAAELSDGCLYQSGSGGGTLEVTGHCGTILRAALLDESLRSVLGFFIVEEDARARLHKHAYGSRADSARAAGNQRHFPGQRHSDRHSRIVYQRRMAEVSAGGT